LSPLPRVRLRMRRGQRDSLAAFILLSLLAHVAGVSMIAGAVSLTPTSNPVSTEPAFFVRLAELPSGGTPQPASSAVAPPPVKQPAQVPVPPKPREKKPVLLPEKPMKAKPKKPEPEPSAATKGPERPQASPPPPSIPSQGTAGLGVPAGEGSVTSLEIPNFTHAWYTASIVSRLKAVWRYPQVPDPQKESVTVSFLIKRDGSVEDVRIETPSRYEVLNLSVLRALHDAPPFPPLPAQYQGDSPRARMVFEPASEP